MDSLDKGNDKEDNPKIDKILCDARYVALYITKRIGRDT